MTLTIEIPCKTETEMEDNLNKAIEDFAKVLARKGFSEMELIAHDEKKNLIYNISIK